jgi:hypothetical protein
MRISTHAIFIILFLLFHVTGRSQDSLSSKYPTAVLVQLRSEHNRIEALTKDRRYNEVEEVKNDAKEVISRMKLDFHNNFDYCPVYYYMDTNADLVKNKAFTGILMNEDGSIVTNPIVNEKNNRYVIAFYGHPVSQSRLKKVETDPAKYAVSNEKIPTLGLVILNDKFQQLTYFYKFKYDELFFGSRRNRKYYYRSKHFEIEYYPFAKLFAETMFNRYGRRRIVNWKNN